MNSDYANYRSKLDDLRKELYSSKGVAIYNHFMSTNATLYAFQVNFAELDQSIQLHYQLQCDNKLGDFHNKKPLDDFLFEVTRRLHNFLFSAKCLVVQTRIFVQEHYEGDSAPERKYNDRVKAVFEESGIDEFTKVLRDFFAHVSTPYVISVRSGTDGVESKRFSLKLDTAEMRRTRLNRGERKHRKVWSPDAIHYAESRGEKIDLQDYAREYFDAVTHLYTWLGEQNREWAARDWNESLRIQDQIDECRREFGGRKRSGY